MWTYLVLLGGVSIWFVISASFSLSYGRPAITPWAGFITDWTWLVLNLLACKYLPAPLVMVDGKLVHPSTLQTLRQKYMKKQEKKSTLGRMFQRIFHQCLSGPSPLADRIYRASAPTAAQLECISGLVAYFRKLGVEEHDKNPTVDHDLRHGYGITTMRATLTVNDEDLRKIAPWHRAGLLKTAGSYECLVRFNVSDEGGVRVSLRVKVPESMQMLAEAPDDTATLGYKHVDMLFAEQLKFFFAPNVSALGIVCDVAQAKGCSLVGRACANLCLLIRFVRAAFRVPNNNTVGVLGKSYYSGLPFKLGSGVCKFGLEPKQKDDLDKSQMPLGKAHASMTGKEDEVVNKYAAAFTSRLNRVMHSGQGKGLGWDLKVQIAKNAPSHNPDVADDLWDESASHYQTFGSLELIPEPAKETGPLFFNPWNMLADHRPVGDLNLARRECYIAHQEMRRKHGKKPEDIVCPYLTHLVEVRKAALTNQGSS
jgi:hypothetical protein